MARTKSNIATVPQDEIPETAATNLAKLQNEEGQRLELITKQFGDGMPYQRERVINEARFYMAQSAEAMLEAGKRLITLKENEPHGEFVVIVENHLGLAPRTAQAMMKAAFKYLSPKLASKAQALAHLGKTKLFELMTEDDEDLAALADGGTVADMTLDDIDRMTSRELKAALRDAREEKKATDQILAEKNTAMDELKAELKKTTTRIQATPPDEVAEQLRSELLAQATGAESAISSGLRAAIDLLTQHDQEHGTDHRAIIAGHFTRIQQVMDDLRNEFAIGAFTTATPEWATEE